MARTARGLVDKGIYHIMARGNQKQEIYRDLEDYERYMGDVRKFKTKFSVSIYSFVLMPNHVHFILSADKAVAFSGFMHALHTAHSVYFNHKYDRVGHLFENRYKSKMILDDVYLIYLSKYVHLNPVRADIVKAPIEYAWSSYRSYLGYPYNDGLVSPGQVLDIFVAQFGGSYMQFVERDSPSAGTVPAEGFLL